MRNLTAQEVKRLCPCRNPLLDRDEEILDGSMDLRGEGTQEGDNKSQQVEVTQNAPIDQPIYVQSTTGLCNFLGDRKQRNDLVDCRKESLRR